MIRQRVLAGNLSLYKELLGRSGFLPHESIFITEIHQLEGIYDCDVYISRDYYMHPNSTRLLETVKTLESIGRIVVFQEF